MNLCVECKKELTDNTGVYNFNEWYCDKCYKKLYVTPTRKTNSQKQAIPNKFKRWYPKDEKDGWDGTS